jgi:hypothetical protein
MIKPFEALQEVEQQLRKDIFKALLTAKTITWKPSGERLI